MSAYENVVGGKLKLKGKALAVKDGGIVKKRKKHKTQHHHHDQTSTGGIMGLPKEQAREDINETQLGEEGYDDDHLTPAERRYLQQWEKIDLQRLAKIASKSHRDRIQEFNQYLANLSEHYDIPKVGRG